MANKRLVVAGLALAAALAVPGCEGPDSQLAVRTNSWVEDVPVPAKFKLNEQESSHDRDRQNNTRQIMHVYEGHAPEIKVRNFFKVNMPAAGWTLENESLDGAVYNLLFSKKRETASVTIKRKTKSGWNPPTEARVVIETPDRPRKGVSEDDNG